MAAIFDALVPLGIFAIIFGTVTAHRYMRHRETMQMIEHGYTPEMLRAIEQHGPAPIPRFPPPSPGVSPPAPFVTAPPPFAPPAVSSAAPPVAPPYPRTVAPPVPRGGRTQVIWGCILVGTGLALSLALWPIGFAVNAGGGAAFPLGIGPWMVAGFIPLFVGLALLLAHVLGSPRRDPPPYLAAPPTYPGASLAEPHYSHGTPQSREG